MAISRLKKVARAETDIADAINYLGERNSKAAWAFSLELDKMLDLIAKFPEWFPRQRRTENPRYREVRFTVIRPFGYLVLYTYEAGTVTIMRVQHGSMNEP